MATRPINRFDINKFDLQHYIDITGSFDVCVWKVTHGNPTSTDNDPNNHAYVLAVSPEHAIAIRNWLTSEFSDAQIPDAILSVELVGASPCIDPRFDIHSGYVNSGQIERRVKANG